MSSPADSATGSFLDPFDTVERLARAIHGTYVEHAGPAQPAPDDPATQPWEDLDQDLQHSNRDHARHIATHLHSLGLALAPLDGSPTRLTDDEIEELSRLEHARWVAERRGAGWRAGPRNGVTRTTPYLVPWQDLSEEVRDLDRLFVRRLPDLLATVGLQVVRPQSWPPPDQEQRKDPPHDDLLPDPVQLAWNRHLAWSHAADRLKAVRERRGVIVLVLGLAGAVLAAGVIGAGAQSPAGRVLAFLSAATVGVAGVLKSRTGPRSVRDWTRARSISEAIKSAVYVRLATGASDEELEHRVHQLEVDAGDLLRLTVVLSAPTGSPPPVHDLESYVRERVLEQAERYYRPRARELERRSLMLHRVTLGVGVMGALLAAAAGTWQTASLAAWVPVTTTVAAAITAQAAAARYDFLVVEYTRTAVELERLVRRHRSGGTPDAAELVAAAECVISTQNRGWLARLGSDDAPA